MSTAAKGNEQEGSQTIFNLSHIIRIALIISPSLIVIISSAPSIIISKVFLDKDVFNPSAIVSGFDTGINFLLLKETYASFAFSGSAKITLVDFEKNKVDNIVPRWEVKWMIANAGENEQGEIEQWLTTGNDYYDVDAEGNEIFQYNVHDVQFKEGKIVRINVYSREKEVESKEFSY